jgi:hypothetical protein
MSPTTNRRNDMKAVLKWVGIGFVGLIVLGAIFGGGEEKATEPVKKVAPAVQKKVTEGVTAEKAEAKPEPKAEPKPEPKPEPPAEPAEPEMTSSQENAVASAEDYLDYSGFSKQGLIGQLSSDVADGYSVADATFAANHVDVDWNQEAVEAAQSYLDYSSFSRDGLIDQLTSQAADKFTLAQATHAVDQVY